MENHFLINKIKELQDEYLDMLIKIKDKIDTEDYMYIIDEINIFWYSNREIVKLYLNNITLEDNAYIFTGATYLDVDDFEQYPFIMMGNIHIVDDPLCKYSKVIPKCKSFDFLKTLRNQIIYSVEDNIKILSNYASIILILPMNLFYDDINMKLIKKSADNVFLSMFSEKVMNMDIYFQKFKSIEDIDKALKPDIEKYIVFDEGEDLEKSLIERFNDYINKTNIPLPKDSNDALKFWMSIYGFITQALDIILCCTNFNLTPYLRYSVTFKYVTLLGENIYSENEIKEILFRCRISHIIYMIFNKERFKNISFDSFYNRLNEYNFRGKVEADIRNEICNLDIWNVNNIVKILNDNIDICFKNI